MRDRNIIILGVTALAAFLSMIVYITASAPSCEVWSTGTAAQAQHYAMQVCPPILPGRTNVLWVLLAVWTAGALAAGMLWDKNNG